MVPIWLHLLSRKLGDPFYVRTITMPAETFPRRFLLQGPCPPPSSVPGALQNDMNNLPGSSPTGYPPPPDEFDIASLPTGWNSVHDNDNYNSTAIVLALSVALAAIIIILFSIVFWRRKHAS